MCVGVCVLVCVCICVCVGVCVGVYVCRCVCMLVCVRGEGGGGGVDNLSSRLLFDISSCGIFSTLCSVDLVLAKSNRVGKDKLADLVN